MKMTLRAALAVSLFLAAALTAYPSLAQDVGFDFWNVNDLQFGISTREQESRSLDRESEITLHRTMIRVEIANDVADGRMTFEEGATRFAEVNRSNSKTLAFTRNSYKGNTDEDRAGWQLVAHLRVLPHPNANAAAEVGTRWLNERT